MITCQNAKSLFDRYLDGELSPGLQTELHAHRLNCVSCQNELAMLETCGDVVALDVCEPVPSASFTDRVLLARRARIRPVRRSWARRLILVGSPIAAAASVVFAVLLILPSARSMQHVIAGAQVRMQDNKMHEVSPREGDQANTTEAPAAGLLELPLATMVEGSKSTVESIRRAAKDLTVLVLQNLVESDPLAELPSAQPEAPGAAALDGAAPSRPAEVDGPAAAEPVSQ